MRRGLWGLAVSLGVGLLIFGVSTMRVLGIFESFDYHEPGECVPIEGIVGGEDLQWRPGGESFFVSSQNRRDAEAEGTIVLVTPGELGAADAKVEEVLPEVEFPFRPHGLFLRVDGEKETLYVINHGGQGRPGSSVEIFDVSGEGRLSHEVSITGELLKNPNDLVALGPREFYVTNDHGSDLGVWKALESLMRLPLGNVLYYDGETFEVVVRGTRYANGINVGAEGNRLYLAETLGRLIRVYWRQPEGQLEEVDVIELQTGVDNIDVAVDGSLWVGAHPHLGRYITHAVDETRRSPSQVLRVEWQGPGRVAVDEIYLGDGKAISGSATAALQGDRVVIGPVFDDRLLYCRQDRNEQN